MSFNLQPINQPLIQGAQQMQNNGGGGNLGYMQQGKKKKDEEKDDEINTNLLEQDESDILDLDFDADKKKKETETKNDGKNEQDTHKKGWLDNIVEKIAENKIKKESNPFKNAST